MSSRPTYKRGQVAWALWRFFTYPSHGVPEPPRVFQTRIKRLLDLDWSIEPSEEMGAYAFSDGPPEGSGVDVRFTPCNAFCLAEAIEMLDAGYRQSDVVFVFRHIRPNLESLYPKIMKHTPPARQRVPATRAPDLPTYERNGRRYADYRVFMILRKVTITEAYPPLEEEAERVPLFQAPLFARGIEGLLEVLDEVSERDRNATVFEIAAAARRVTTFLEKSPELKRGRQ